MESTNVFWNLLVNLGSKPAEVPQPARQPPRAHLSLQTRQSSCQPRLQSEGQEGVSGDKRQDLVTQGAASGHGPLLPGMEHGGMCGVQRWVGNQRFPLVLSQPLEKV